MTGARILIWGAGGHGHVVADVAQAAGWTIAGFISQAGGEDIQRTGVSSPAFPDAAIRAALATGGPLPAGATALALGIGANDVRAAVAALIPDALLPVLRHPSAVVSPSARIAPGTVLLPMVVVNARAEIGRGTILNTGAIVEHDCRVGAGAHLSPGAIIAGEVVVESLAWIGTGAVVIPRRVIGAGAIVGAGSTAHRDVPAGTTVVGNPARVVPGK